MKKKKKKEWEIKLNSNLQAIFKTLLMGKVVKTKRSFIYLSWVSTLYWS